MRIAIMQPYFLPYAGYFRLFSHTDLFVIYDCVQFIRRGWIHRNRFPDTNGELIWVTLPLAKTPQDTNIMHLHFHTDAVTLMNDQLNKFPLFKNKDFLDSHFSQMIRDFNHSPVQYIARLLESTCKMLDLPFNVAYSSDLNLPTELKGENRIIEIAKHFKADTYLNPPGGKDLYNAACFKDHNLKLEFLNDYVGNYESILPRLFHEDVSKLRHEITSQ